MVWKMKNQALIVLTLAVIPRKGGKVTQAAAPEAGVGNYFN